MIFIISQIVKSSLCQFTMPTIQFYFIFTRNRIECIDCVNEIEVIAEITKPVFKIGSTHHAADTLKSIDQELLLLIFVGELDQYVQIVKMHKVLTLPAKRNSVNEFTDLFC